MVYLKEENFGEAKKFTWVTNSGISISVITYGAIIYSIKVPDKTGRSADVALGFENLNDYIGENYLVCLGCVCGRCINRIDNGQFKIDGEPYQVTRNRAGIHLHGGFKGFDRVFWNPCVVGTQLVLSYLSKDGEEGYPGAVITNITYDVTEDATLHIDYLATTTKKTVVNLANHCYFNLAGHDAEAKELYEHVVTLNCDRYTETKPDTDCIPSGKLPKVGGTPYDLRAPKRLGDIISQHPALFHDNLCVAKYGNEGLTFIARVVHPSSGRTMEVYSDQPGVQFYTGQFLPSMDQPALVGKGGCQYRKDGGFCLETQNYPDAINQPNFPSPILVPGQVYRNSVKYTETKPDTDCIPSGKLPKVGGTPYDLRAPKRLGDIISQHPALFHDNLCVAKYGNEGLTFIARVVHPSSGRTMEVYSDQPGVQFYTGQFLPSMDQPALVGKGGCQYRKDGGFCLETQNYPDAINQPNFPSPILVPGQVYRNSVKYVFGVTHN